MKEVAASKYNGDGGGTSKHSGSRLQSGSGSQLQIGNGSQLFSAKGPAKAREGAKVGHPREEETSKHGSSQQRDNINTKSASRRRALIQAFSKEEEENDLLPSQPFPLKVKTTPYHDADINMHLDNVTPERGGNSLQISTSQDEHGIVPYRAAMSLDRLDTINIANTTPPPHSYKSPRKETANDTQSAKRRRMKLEDTYTTPS